MDVDEDSGELVVEEEEDDSEEVPQMKLTLAGEQDLEGVSVNRGLQLCLDIVLIAARATYARIFSEHIYSLSPSPVLVCQSFPCGPFTPYHSHTGCRSIVWPFRRSVRRRCETEPS